MTVCLFFVGSFLGAFGHQDTDIELKDGVLVGLPKEFHPAKFDVKSYELTIKGKVLEFPELVEGMFDDETFLDDEAAIVPHRVGFSGSWYHHSATLPCYLSVQIYPKGREFSYCILVDMETPKVLEARIVVKLGDRGNRSFPIQLEEPELPPLKVTKWEALVGDWVNIGGTLKISENMVETVLGERIEHMSGKVVSKMENQATLIQADGEKDELIFELKEGWLSFNSILYARKGSEEEKVLLRRIYGEDFNESEEGGE